MRGHAQPPRRKPVARPAGRPQAVIPDVQRIQRDFGNVAVGRMIARMPAADVKPGLRVTIPRLGWPDGTEVGEIVELQTDGKALVRVLSGDYQDSLAEFDPASIEPVAAGAPAPAPPPPAPAPKAPPPLPVPPGPPPLRAGPAPGKLAPPGGARAKGTAPSVVTAPTGPGKLLPGQATLLLSVDDSALDEGSKLLKRLHHARPPKVNDAFNDKLSNCAMTTLAAFTGDTTSGGATTRMRRLRGLDASPLGADKGEQSQKAWAIALQDAATLAAAGLAVPLSVDQHARSRATVKSIEEFQEGNAFVLGPAQYYGMLEYLRRLAGEESGPGVEFKVYAYGRPALDELIDQPTLLAGMNGYPNGTRFAVFMYSDTPGQEVAQHWVYAERFNNQVIFRDFQINQTDTKPADAYLAQFPFSPKASDKGKGFSKGAFVACAPLFSGQPPLVIGAGREVDPDEPARVLGGVKGKLAVLSAQIEAPGEALPRTWPALGGGTALTEMPLPSAVEDAHRQVAADFGLAPTPRIPAINVIGAPTHGSSRVRKVFGSGTTRVERDVPSDVMTFATINPSIGLVDHHGGPAGTLPPRPGGKEKKEDRYREAAAVAYQIDAQATNEGLEINALTSAFTDLIHEFAHAFEGMAGPTHLREGMAEVFGSMAAHKLDATSGDRFAFTYNPTYAAYTAAVQELAQVVGLQTVARLFYGERSSHKTFLIREIQALAPTAAADSVEQIAADLTDESFPAAFRNGLAALRALTRSPAAAAPAAADATYSARATSFAAFLDAKAKEYETKFCKTLAGGDALATAEKVQQFGGLDRAEKRLRLYYSHRHDVGGDQLVELMKLIDGHEHSLAAALGTPVEAVRKRLLPVVTISFEVAHAVPAGDVVHVAGDVDELGEWKPERALPLTEAGGRWQGTLELPATGSSLSYQYLVKRGTAVAWEVTDAGACRTRRLPNAAATPTFGDTWGDMTVR